MGDLRRVLFQGGCPSVRRTAPLPDSAETNNVMTDRIRQSAYQAPHIPQKAAPYDVRGLRVTELCFMPGG